MTVEEKGRAALTKGTAEAKVGILPPGGGRKILLGWRGGGLETECRGLIIKSLDKEFGEFPGEGYYVF